MVPYKLGVALQAVFGSALAWQEQCQNFQDVGESTKLVASTYYNAGDLVNLTSLANTITNDSLPAFCRLELRITTNEDTGSYAVTEVWLPDSWNDRMIGVGNGGWNGGVNYQDLGYVAVNRSFAGFSSNSGHNSTAFDASWALNNDDAIIDNAYRAYHLSVLTTKHIIKSYYGRAQKTAIWSGCSTAGRQGLKAAQEFPEDFDSVIVGSPANWWTHLQSWGIYLSLLIGDPSADTWVTQDEWVLVHQTVLDQCDAMDGLVDGIVGLPYQCREMLDLGVLACGAQQTEGCLTQTQISTINKVYADYYEDGNFVFTSMLPGSELTFQMSTLGPVATPIATEFWKYLIYNDTTWSVDDYSYAFVQLADKINPGPINSIKPNLDAFKARGGKIMFYVGLEDTAISPGNARTYRNSVADYYGENIDDFFRLYEVPGMGHCLGGPGASGFGGILQTALGNPPVEYTPEYDITSALIAWYEDGRVPEKLIGASYNGGQVANGLNFTRPLCTYPKNAQYVGGDEKKADSFECQ